MLRVNATSELGRLRKQEFSMLDLRSYPPSQARAALETALAELIFLAVGAKVGLCPRDTTRLACRRGKGIRERSGNLSGTVAGCRPCGTRNGILNLELVHDKNEASSAPLQEGHKPWGQRSKVQS